MVDEDLKLKENFLKMMALIAPGLRLSNIAYTEFYNDFYQLEQKLGKLPLFNIPTMISEEHQKNLEILN